MIRVHLTLSGPLREYYKSGPSSRTEAVILEAGARVADVMAAYGIAAGKVHFIIVNRRKADIGIDLKDGDHVWLVPLAAGG